MVSRNKSSKRRPWFRSLASKMLCRKPWAQAFAAYYRKKVLCRQVSHSSSTDMISDNLNNVSEYSETHSTMDETNVSLNKWNVILNHNNSDTASSDVGDFTWEYDTPWLESNFDDSGVVENTTTLSKPMEQCHSNRGNDDEQDGIQPDPPPNTFVFESSGAMVAVLNPPCRVVFCGKAQVQVLRGCLKVLGYRITPELRKPVPVFSSSSYCLLTMDTDVHDADKSSSGNMFETLKKMGMSHLNNCIEDVLTPSSVVVVLHRLEVKEVSYACSVTKEIFCFPEEELAQSKEKAAFYRRGFCLLPATVKYHHWVDSAEFSHIIDTILSESKDTSGIRILVCGGKNVGKSTLICYLMNRMLNTFSEVYHLEGDPGQTQFTPSACVSLTKVTKPVLGPAFTHQQKPAKTVGLGSVNVPDIPDVYVDAIVALLAHYWSAFAEKPLFVNTMGWNVGLGLALLTDVVRIVRPTHVIQLKCGFPFRRHNLPYVTPEYVNSSRGWRSNDAVPPLKYSWLLMDSVAMSQPKSAISAPLKRSLALLAYLGKLQSEFYPFKPINCFKPYVLPWSCVAVYTCKHNISLNQILCSLNCSWVVLCHSFAVTDNAVTNDDGADIKMLTVAPMNECLGFGIIRGINPVKKLFYIITPEPLHVLKDVNLLLRGNTNFPEHLLLKQTGSSPIPFLSKVTERRNKDLGRGVISRVYRIKRANYTYKNM